MSGCRVDQARDWGGGVGGTGTREWWGATPAGASAPEHGGGWISPASATNSRVLSGHDA